MLKEALDALEVLVAKSVETEIVRPPAEPPHVYGVKEVNGDLEWRTAQPTPRAHVAMDLSAIIAFALRFHNPPDFPSAVWYSRKEVKCLINDDERRDSVTLTLTPSVPLAKLMALEANPVTIPQAAAVLMLRTTFAGCVGPEFIATIRRLKFRNSDGTQVAVEHGRSSMGRTLESEVTGEGNIPEYVTFEVPVFLSGFQANAPVMCAVEPIPGQGAFMFIPLPGQIESAFATAEGYIETALSNDLGEKEVPVLYGRVA